MSLPRCLQCDPGQFQFQVPAVVAVAPIRLSVRLDLERCTVWLVKTLLTVNPGPVLAEYAKRARRNEE